MPVKPSVTTTCTSPSGMSLASILPTKFSPELSSSLYASISRSLPLVSSEPMFSRPTLGELMPMTFSMYALPIAANCTSISGRHSVFAPASMSTKLPLSPGITGEGAIRLIPLIRLTMKVAPNTRAPVLPADTKASPLFSARRVSPTAMEVFFPDLISSFGSSCISKTSSV